MFFKRNAHAPPHNKFLRWRLFLTWTNPWHRSMMLQLK
jgi:hypothetical protein